MGVSVRCNKTGNTFDSAVVLKREKTVESGDKA